MPLIIYGVGFFVTFLLICLLVGLDLTPADEKTWSKELFKIVTFSSAISILWPLTLPSLALCLIAYGVVTLGIKLAKTLQKEV